MIRLRVDPASPDPAALEQAGDAIRAGLAVAFPTDTLYGIAVDPTSTSAVARLFALKQRPALMAVPLVAADLQQVESRAGDLSPLGRRLAARFWPGPLTLVIRAHASIVPDVHGGRGAVAVRVPAHETARAFARMAGRPLTATSANRSGEPPAATAEAVVAALGDDVHLILDAGPTPGGPPSTIIDATGDMPTLVRDGAVPWARVLESLE